MCLERRSANECRLELAALPAWGSAVARNPSAALRASADTYVSARIPNWHFANLELGRSYLYSARRAHPLQVYYSIHNILAFRVSIPSRPRRGYVYNVIIFYGFRASTPSHPLPRMNPPLAVPIGEQADIGCSSWNPLQANFFINRLLTTTIAIMLFFILISNII